MDRLGDAGTAGLRRVATAPGDGGGAPTRVLPRWARVTGAAFVVVTIPLCAVLSQGVGGKQEFVTALALVATVYTVPGLAVAVAAERRVAGERVAFRLWGLGFGGLLVIAWLVQQEVTHGLKGLGQAVPPIAALSIALIAAANVLVVRGRSGQRAALVDATESLMATLALVVPLGLVAARPVFATENALFAATTAMTAAGACHGAVVAVTVLARVAPGRRLGPILGLAVMAAAFVDASAITVYVVTDFTLPAPPFIALDAVALGLAVTFFLWSERDPTPGLGRLPPQAQVRRHATVGILVLVAVPVIAVEAWLLRDHGGLVAAAMVSALVLLALSCARQRLSVGETIRLYSAVEQAADKRGRLLADVIGHVEADRHRVAAHLHEQALALYAAMTSFTASLEPVAPSRVTPRDRAGALYPVPGPGLGTALLAGHASPFLPGAGPGPEGTTTTAAASAAERLREDLGQQVDELRQVAVAVAPLPPRPRAGDAVGPLAALVRAHVESLYGDAPKPTLTVEVDPDLELGWTVEAVVLRIVQEATHNVWRHARAEAVAVTISGAGGRLTVEVLDDGVGPGRAPEGRGVASMRAVAGFIDGTLTVGPAPGGGTRVRATVETAPLEPPHRRPRFTVVPGP